MDNSTNALADVAIDVEGIVRVTRNFSGGKQQRFSRKTLSQKDGSFTLNFRAADFRIVFSKPNYIGREYSFTHAEDNTNQNLFVIME